MKSKIDLSDWLVDKQFLDEDRIARIKIHFVYPELEGLIKFSPPERVTLINADQTNKLERLLALKLFDDYEVIGKIKRPGGIIVNLAFNDLQKLNGLDFVSSIYVTNISGAKRAPVKKASIAKFYSVKMTVVIDEEGIGKGKQSIEERIVLVKALSFEDAYAKIEDQKAEYATPYLNGAGRLVRWRIESFDDCYDTDIEALEEFQNSAGVEIYSKLKSRKRKGDFVWDGK